MTRTRLARGIYRDAYGHEVRWREAGHTRAKRFPPDVALAHLTAFRDTKERLATQRRQHDAGGSFPRDAVKFLAGRKGIVSWKSDRAHLRPWIHRFAKLSRYAISADTIQMAIADWNRKGYSPRELRHRLRILRQCLATLNGADAQNPCTAVKLPKVQKTRPRSVSDTLVREVALQLRKQEANGIGRLRNAKTRARFLVLATTGQRPAQLRRAKLDDVDLDRRIWFVEPAKGDNGAIVYLNDDMVAAWTLFIAARAWGAYDGRSFAKTLQRNGWPKGIRPYNLRHTVGLTMSELGVDLGDISAHMGHANINTTRQAYVPAVLSRLRDASERIDGRLSVAAATLPHKSDTPTPEGKANTVQNTPQFASGARGANLALRAAKSMKLA